MQKFQVGGTAYGSLPPIVDSAGDPVVPTAVTCKTYKNGSGTATGESVTVSAYTEDDGLYRWSYNPAGDAEFDVWSLQFRIEISGVYYYHHVDLQAVVAERGTDSASTPTNVSDAQTAILAKLPDALVDGKMDSYVAGSSGVPVVQRSEDDTDGIRFSWPSSSATVTGTVSIGGAAYQAVAGAIAFLRTEGGLHYFELAYNAADRAAGSVRYQFEDGTTTRWVNLEVVPNLALRGGLTEAQAFDLLVAAAIGLTDQPDADTEKFLFVDGVDAFTTTFDTSGNRTAVVLH